MEVTATITSVRIPALAAMLKLEDQPNTEFNIGSGRIVVVRDSDGYIEARKGFPPYSDVGDLKAGAVAIFTVPYYTDRAPYTIYTEVRVQRADGTKICRADCSLVADSTEWYLIDARLNLPPGSPGLSQSLICPISVCTVGYYINTIAVEPEHVIIDDEEWPDFYEMDTPFWRSPALYTIN